MSEEDVPVDQTKPASTMRRAVIYAGVLLIVFLLGSVPMWLRARDSAAQLARVEQQLNLARLQNTLAGATIDARRGDYEPARQSASDFFTTLRAEIDKGEASIFNTAQRNAMQSLFAQRDELITLLARSDPASADRLSALFASYRTALNG